MRGQWIGRYHGQNDGDIIVNVDEFPAHYQGIAYLIESNPALPRLAAYFYTTDKSKEFNSRSEAIAPFDPVSGQITTREALASRFSGLTIPTYADVNGSWDDSELRLCWKTDIARTGQSVLRQLPPTRESDLQAAKYDWTAFKNYVATLTGRNLLFRGQNRPWRLRTSFHRRGRADVMRFQTKDLVELHKHLSAKTKHVFNLLNPDENGALLNLIQHHGYPTPILDWTYSPYVAAFFAYRGISNEEAERADPTAKVRIHVFDQARWKSKQLPVFILAPAQLHFSVHEFLAIENERMIPQQAASTVTNVDDIEAFIKSKETDNTPFLTAIDLPTSQRKQVVRELEYMGITAGSLFPGLDGACEDLTERNFEI
jgi:FRG domain-containing protein